jgi:hypothetical protein
MCFFWGTLRLIATGIGTSLALKGNILGPILFLLVFNAPEEGITQPGQRPHQRRFDVINGIGIHIFLLAIFQKYGCQCH